MKDSVKSAVPQHEVDSRMREYREHSSEKQTMPRIIYRPAHVTCPWPGCRNAIAGIDFNLEFLDDRALYQKLMEAWWKGAGIVGRCPGCNNHVRFTMDGKQQVNDLQEPGLAVLPDDWHQHAYLLPRQEAFAC